MTNLQKSSKGNVENFLLLISAVEKAEIKNPKSIATAENLIIAMARNEVIAVKQREVYFNAFIAVGISWLVFTGCIIYANGVEDDWQKFSTSDGIVMTLIGSSVIPPLTLIGKSLFDQSKD